MRMQVLDLLIFDSVSPLLFSLLLFLSYFFSLTPDYLFLKTSLSIFPKVPSVLHHHTVALSSFPKFQVLSPDEIRISVWNHTVDSFVVGVIPGKHNLYQHLVYRRIKSSHGPSLECSVNSSDYRPLPSDSSQPEGILRRMLLHFKLNHWIAIGNQELSLRNHKPSSSPQHNAFMKFLILMSAFSATTTTRTSPIFPLFLKTFILEKISDELDKRVKKFLRGPKANLEGLKDKKLKGQHKLLPRLRSLFVFLNWLLPSEGGYLEIEGIEKTWRINCFAPINAAKWFTSTT